MLSFNDEWPVLAAGVRIFELTECCLNVDDVTDVISTDDAVCDVVFGLSTGWCDAGEANI